MKKGFTLVEMLVVLFIFSFLFAALLVILTNSDRSWRIGQNKLIEQQEARRAMSSMVRLLRQSSPDWGIYINATQDKIQFSSAPIVSSCPVSLICPDGSSCSEGDFCISKTRVIFKIDPDDPHQLIKQEGTGAAWVPVAQYIESIKFSGGGCTGCDCNFSNAACSSCVTIDQDCPLVKIEVKTKKENEFTLVSYVNLRNTSPSSVVEPQAEGEF